MSISTVPHQAHATGRTFYELRTAVFTSENGRAGSRHVNRITTNCHCTEPEVRTLLNVLKFQLQNVFSSAIAFIPVFHPPRLCLRKRSRDSSAFHMRWSSCGRRGTFNPAFDWHHVNWRSRWSLDELPSGMRNSTSSVRILIPMFKGSAKGYFPAP
jgi:hypothetical protein